MLRTVFQEDENYHPQISLDEYLHVERQINRWKEIVTRFKSKLVKMIKDANIRFDGYSFSRKIRWIL